MNDNKWSIKKLVAIVITILILLATLGSCGNDNEYDELMSSQDWGPDHYYSRSTHQVEEKVHW